MSRIFWDTNLYIYLFQGSSRSSQRVAEIRDAMNQRGDQLLTSTLTIGEVLVGPGRASRGDLKRQYEKAIAQTSLLIPFDLEAARVFADIRTDRAIKPPDAIQLACAAVAKSDMFITNDDRLSRKNIPGIHFIVPLERAFL
jgi:uncharacterized protein